MICDDEDFLILIVRDFCANERVSFSTTFIIWVPSYLYYAITSHKTLKQCVKKSLETHEITWSNIILWLASWATQPRRRVWPIPDFSNTRRLDAGSMSRGSTPVVGWDHFLPRRLLVTPLGVQEPTSRYCHLWAITCKNSLRFRTKVLLKRPLLSWGVHLYINKASFCSTYDVG